MVFEEKSEAAATVIYKNYLSSSGINQRFWSLGRKLLIRYYNDPNCTLPIHGRELRLPLSHSLPTYLHCFPFYDRLPQRLSAYIHQTQGYLNCIDVGANIGDTLAAFYTSDADLFLAIEPNPTFNALLTMNWGWNDNITVISELCSSTSEKGKFTIQENRGTASFYPTTTGINLRRRRLDDIVADFPTAFSANVLKIDTDGHDFDIIAGAEGLLVRNRPALLFECHFIEGFTYFKDYVNDCLSTLDMLKQIGYDNFLLYDNFGYLMGCYSLTDLSSFRALLFYQLTSKFYYFDILLMSCEKIQRFYQTEIDLFAGQISNTTLRKAMLAATV